MNDLDRVAALSTVGERIREIDLGLGLADAAEAESVAAELANQISDYLVPRLRRLDAPLLAVLGGSTGSGKSTITNSIAGAAVSPAGVLRPTTRGPVLICHPTDVEWFQGDDILPQLPRLSGSGAPAAGTLSVETIDGIGPGLALIDAPDIDSVEDANRELATQLLAAADLWLFVTTAMRYADAVPWEFLDRAKHRGTALAIVINRIPPGAGDEIVPHLTAMLAERGLDGITVYPIEQAELIDERLAPDAVAPLRSMLEELGADAERRAAIVRQTVDGAIASIPERADVLLEASAAQDAAADDLRLAMEAVYQSTKEQLAEDLAAGALLRGEVLDRWQELIGTSEMMRAIQSRITAVRDRITGFIRGRAPATNEVQGEITSALEQLLIDHADGAALRVADTWRQRPGGRVILGNDHELEHASEELRSNVGREIRAWQDDILELVSQQGAGKRNMARAMAFGVNGIGVALMIVLFAQTGGITGGEVAVASGTATLSQTLLNAIFGEQAVRELVATARTKLSLRIDTLLDIEANRFRAALWSTVSPEGATTALRSALDELDTLR